MACHPSLIPERLLRKLRKRRTGLSAGQSRLPQLVRCCTASRDLPRRLSARQDRVGRGAAVRASARPWAMRLWPSYELRRPVGTKSALAAAIAFGLEVDRQRLHDAI